MSSETVDEYTEEQSSVSKLKEIYKTASTEHANASIGKRAVLGTTLGAIGFEWSSGNESMLGLVGSHVHNLTHSPIVTGLATGSASFVEQGAIGTLMAVTINNYPEVTAKIREIVSGDKDVKEDTHLRRYGSAMLLGAGVELAKENAERPHDKSENVRRALGSAGLIAVSNTALFAGLSGLLKLGEEHGFESTSETVVNVASNPLTYAGAILGIIGFNKLKRQYKKAKDQPKHRKLKQDALEEAAGE